MAYVTGTVSDAASFWTLLLDFLKTNSTLVSAAQNWTQVWNSADSSQIVLRGPGLSGSDEIYVGFRYQENATTDEHAIFLRGMTGVLTAATDMSEHFGLSNEVAFFADTNPMQYWVVANGRRFVVVLKISTIYEHAYAGLFLPYSPPTSYPYPVFLGGSKGYKSLTTNNWRSVENGHKAYFNPYRDNTLDLDNVPTAAYILDPLGATWYPVVNQGFKNDSNIAHLLPGYAGSEDAWGGPDISDLGAVEPANAGSNTMGYAPAYSKTRRTLDDGYALVPLTLVQTTPAITTWGLLDGVYACPGAGNSSENTLTIGSDTYAVFQDIFRTNNSDYMALRLG